MAYFHTNVLDNQIKALDTIGTASGSIATFETDRADNLINLEVAITATQSGSGTPSPSNPRPINGFSACDVVACGKNLLDCASHANATSSNLTISANSDGSISYNGMPSNSWAFLTASFNYYLPSGTTVTFSRQQAFAYRHYLQITYADNSSDTLIIENNTTSVTKTFTKSIIKLQLIVSGLSTSATYNDNVKLMLNIGASVLPYEAYNGTTYTVNFGQTVYGGRLNVGSGVLTVTHGYVDLGTLTWNSISLDRWVANNISNIKSVTSSTTVANIKAEKYPTYSHNDLANNNQVGIDCLYSDLFVRNSPPTDTPTGLCIFELANPIVIQLDSKQIQAIIGTNNIYADTGDIIDLKFILSVGQAIS